VGGGRLAAMVPASPHPESSGRWLRIPSLLAAVASLALALGWWLGERQALQRRAADPRSLALASQVDRLEDRLSRGQAGPAEQQRLLELLVALQRQEEAITLLETMADREPDRRSLRLLLAELRREAGDRAGAERELRQILSRSPDSVEALQQWSQLQLEQGRGLAAEARVRQAYNRAVAQPTSTPTGLPLGLLLAEIQLRRGTPAGAAATYRQLAAAYPTDRRPLLGLALVLKQRGDRRGAVEALALARQRGGQPDQPDALLDGLAARWALEPLRASPASGPRSR
jgi:predicted Zn-dependent protease